ncbi:MAG: hypothetical protein RIF37_07160 [Rhodospirillaceae bacterium]
MSSTPGRSKMNKSRIFLYLMLAIPVGLMIVPTMIVLMFSLLPSAVAFLMERGKGIYAGLCVGAMNLAGASPYLADLWFSGHTTEGAFEIITDVFAVLVIYGCAAFGWAIYAFTPSFVSAFMAMTAGRRIAALQTTQKDLVLKWGSDVQSVYEPEPEKKN